jgi:hypothetical protein
MLEGVAESAYADETSRLYRAGETLRDYPGTPHRLFRNVDPQRPLRFLIAYIGNKGEPYVITP